MKKKDWAQLGNGLAFLSPWLIGFSVFTLIAGCAVVLLQPVRLLAAAETAVYRPR
jgi:hypothetical protein